MKCLAQGHDGGVFISFSLLFWGFLCAKGEIYKVCIWARLPLLKHLSLVGLTDSPATKSHHWLRYICNIGLLRMFIYHFLTCNEVYKLYVPLLMNKMVLVYVACRLLFCEFVFVLFVIMSLCVINSSALITCDRQTLFDIKSSIEGARFCMQKGYGTNYLPPGRLLLFHLCWPLCALYRRRRRKCGQRGGFAKKVKARFTSSKVTFSHFPNLSLKRE